MADEGYYRPYRDEEEDEEEADDIIDDGDDGDSLLDDEEDLAADDLENQRQGDLDAEDIFDLINSPNFRSFADTLRLISAAGPAFGNQTKQIKYGRNRIGKRTTYSDYNEAYAESDAVKKLPEYGRTKAETREITNNPILIDSRKRDRKLYAQPTFFSTRLPRVYRNITTLSFAEMNFLNRFYYFRRTKNNVDITVNEYGRPSFTYTLREGSYDINGLKAEIETQLNRTPIFYDFPSPTNPLDYEYSYNTFYNKFALTKDFSLNFNLPGSNFYNNIDNTFVQNPGPTTIVNYYWGSNVALSLGANLNDQQIFLAYYYPVLKECIVDEKYGADLDLTAGIGYDPGITTPEQVKLHIVYNFKGLNVDGAGSVDPIVYAVALANRGLLDTYRLAHTFRNSLINAYSMAISSQDSRVTISANGLNLSLRRLLNFQFGIYSSNYLSNLGISLADYYALKSNVNLLDAILTDMYNFHQTQFADFWAVPYGSYTPGYYADLLNTVKLRPGRSAVGIPSNPSEAATSNIVATDVDILAPLQVNPKVQWKNLSGLSNNTVSMVNLSNVNRGNLNHPYNTVTNIIDTDFQVIDISNGSGTYYIQPNAITKKVDCVVPIEAGKYTTFMFHSPVRQTLQVETLPRPPQYRYPAYNQVNYGSTINQYFSTVYTYDISGGDYPNYSGGLYDYRYDNLYKNSLTDISGWQSTDSTRWLTSYSESKGFLPFADSLAATIAGTNGPWLGLFYKFTTPDVSGSDADTAYRYPLNFTTELYSDIAGTTLFPPDNTFRVFIYQDRAGLEGDTYVSSFTALPIQTNYRSEDPLNWKYSTVIGLTDTSGTIGFAAYPGQTYYVSIRADSTAFGTRYVRAFPWFASDASASTIAMTRSVVGMNPGTDDVVSPAVYLSNYNYAQAYDGAALALPNASTLWGQSPDEELASFSVDINPSRIGYDISNVSNDYLDYLPYRRYVSTFVFDPYAGGGLGLDPKNRYLFQSNSPYDDFERSYFYTGSSNQVYGPNAFFTYPGATAAVPYRQDKIAHYYSPTYIPEPAYVIQAGGGSVASLITDGPAQQPYTSSTTNGPIEGFLYDSSGHINMNFGTLGFTFAPSDGLWSIDRVGLRSAVYSATAAGDPNSAVAYLGIFKMADINQVQFVNWTMSTAVAVLSNSDRRAYAPRTNNYDIFNDPNDAGFDIRGGTYYEYKWDSNFVPPLRSSTIEGYTKPLGLITNDPADLYSIICLDSNYQPTTFKAMSGSAVPYPFYNQVSTGMTYLDTGIGSPAAIPPRGLVMPSSIITDISSTEWKFLEASLSNISVGAYGPPDGYEGGTQSLYLQSMPIATSVLHTRRQNDPFIDVTGIQPWTTQYYPDAVYMRGSAYVMVKAADFYIYTFDQETTVKDIPAGDLVYTITASDIFSAFGGVSLVGACATTTDFYFLGWKTTSPTSTTTYIMRFEPQTNTLSSYTPATPIVIADGSPSFNSFTVNNAGDVIISVYCPGLGKSVIYKYDATTTTVADVSGAASVRLIHDQDPSGTYFYTLNVSNATGKGVELSIYGATVITDISSYTLAPETGAAPSYSGLGVNSLTGQVFEDPILVVDDIILYSKDVGYEDRLYQVRELVGPTTMSVEPLATVFADASGSLTIKNVVGGYAAGYWALTDRPPYGLWGNRNNAVDLNYRVDSEWQVFYPYQKISLVQTGTSINPMLDVSALEPAEYLHTQLYYYQDASSYYADVSGKWGLEKNTNFYVADTQFRGNYFNSYIFDVPLKASSGSDYQFITVRGYSPTEAGEAFMRFNLRNLYDYGYATFVDISNEIQLYSTVPALFNPEYGDTLQDFDLQYIQPDRKWGQNSRAGYLGSNYQTVDYTSFISTYSTVYYQYRSTSEVINTIDIGVTSTLKQFIETDLRYIMPSTAYQRQNYLDPLPFQLPWLTALPEEFKPLKDNWGLGYNLGYAKMDTNYNTFHKSDSAYKIVDDYIYLQINQQDNMNRLDICEEENYDRTSEFTGAVNRYYGKLLLNGFNQKCTNLVQNSVKFSPPLARLDKFTFNWVDQTGVQLDNTECDWSATVAITERKTVQVSNDNGDNALAPALQTGTGRI
jgi:hypothetical protein